MAALAVATVVIASLVKGGLSQTNCLFVNTNTQKENSQGSLILNIKVKDTIEGPFSLNNKAKTDPAALYAQCFYAPIEWVTVSSTDTDAWSGSVTYTTDGTTYLRMKCVESGPLLNDGSNPCVKSTQNADVAQESCDIVVDGDPDGSDQAPVTCLNGNKCKLIPDLTPCTQTCDLPAGPGESALHDERPYTKSHWHTDKTTRDNCYQADCVNMPEQKKCDVATTCRWENDICKKVCSGHLIKGPCEGDATCLWVSTDGKDPAHCKAKCAQNKVKTTCDANSKCEWDGRHCKTSHCAINMLEKTCDADRKCDWDGKHCKASHCATNKLSAMCVADHRCDWDSAEKYCKAAPCFQNVLKTTCDADHKCDWDSAEKYCKAAPCFENVLKTPCDADHKCDWDSAEDHCKAAPCFQRVLKTTCDADHKCDWDSAEKYCKAAPCFENVLKTTCDADHKCDWDSAEKYCKAAPCFQNGLKTTCGADYKECEWDSAEVYCKAVPCAKNRVKATCDADFKCDWDSANTYCKPAYCAKKAVKATCDADHKCDWDAANQHCKASYCAQNSAKAPCEADHKCDWDSGQKYCKPAPCLKNTVQATCDIDPKCDWDSAQLYCKATPCSKRTVKAMCDAKPWCDWDSAATICKTTCLVNHNVVGHECKPCPTGKFRDAGDKSTGGSTECELPCLVGQFWKNNGCTSCSAGTTLAAGDKASETAVITTCQAVGCAQYTGPTTCDAVLKCDWDSAKLYCKPAFCVQHTDPTTCDADLKCDWDSVKLYCKGGYCVQNTDETTCDADQKCDWDSAKLYCKAAACSLNTDKMMCDADLKCDWDSVKSYCKASTRCSLSERVVDHKCVGCPAGQTNNNPLGDLRSDKDGECRAFHFCVKISTVNDGTLDVWINSGDTTPEQVLASSGTILRKCYSNPVAWVRVQNPSIEPWRGSIQYSSHGGISYDPLVCLTNCDFNADKSVNSNSLVVVGNSGANDKSSLSCSDGKICELAPYNAMRFCLSVVTGTSADNDGTLHVKVESGGKQQQLKSGRFAQAEIVVEKCFPDPVDRVWVKNPTADSWTGEIEYSYDAKQNWNDMNCSECGRMGQGGEFTGSITVVNKNAVVEHRTARRLTAGRESYCDKGEWCESTPLAVGTVFCASFSSTCPSGYALRPGRNVPCMGEKCTVIDCCNIPTDTSTEPLPHVRRRRRAGHLGCRRRHGHKDLPFGYTCGHVSIVRVLPAFVVSRRRRNGDVSCRRRNSNVDTPNGYTCSGSSIVLADGMRKFSTRVRIPGIVASGSIAFSCLLVVALTAAIGIAAVLRRRAATRDMGHKYMANSETDEDSEKAAAQFA